MAECQAGLRWEGGGTGGFCKKRDLCRSEGRCHFVAKAELHEELMQAKADQSRRNAQPTIHWVDGFDEPATPRIVVIPGVTW